MAKWRVSLDVPYNFTVEQGYQKTQHCKEFAPGQNAFAGTYRCPVTGVVMLYPSFLERDFGEDFRSLDDWQHAANVWQKVKRAQAEVEMFSTAPASDYSISDIELLIAASVITVNALDARQDNLVWALASNFVIGPDEMFALHYHGLTDEMTRRNNWFAISWDNIYVHFSMKGFVRVFQYLDRTDLTSYTQVDEFQICSPGEIINKHGYFVFMPIPGYGLVLLHSLAAQRSVVDGVSVNAGAPRGHLIPWQARTMADGTGRLFDSSLIRIALNSHVQQFAHLLGFQHVTFPASGTYTDGVYDPGYKASLVPNVVAPGILQVPQRGISMAVRKPDDSADWEPGIDKPFCCRFALSTSDPLHTPFLYGWTGRWFPVFATRNTTPLVLQRVTPDAENPTPGTPKPAADRAMKLEIQEDEFGRFEARLECLLSSAQGQRIAERADATCLVEYSEDNELTWQTLFGGFAQDWKVEPHYDALGFAYVCNVQLRDMWVRFKECSLISDTALDGLPAGDAINALLAASQQPQLAAIPPYAQKVVMPGGKGNKLWSFKPRASDDFGKALQSILLMLHTQGIEWQLRYNWPGVAWNLLQKPHDSSTGATWKLSPFAADKNAGAKVWWFADKPDYNPEPPEGNVFLVIGKTDVDTKARRVFSGQPANTDSLYNPSSKDYLGRVVPVVWPLDVLPEQGQVDNLVLRLMAEAGHKRDKITLHIPQMNLNLKPNTHVQIYKGALSLSANLWIDGWIKGRNITVEQDDKETMTIDVDSVWESESRK